MVHDGDDAGPSPEGSQERCTYCGSTIDVTNWHPLLSRIEGGDLHLYAFCDVECRDAWLED